jgi:hypothetical protein
VSTPVGQVQDLCRAVQHNLRVLSAPDFHLNSAQAATLLALDATMGAPSPMPAGDYSLVGMATITIDRGQVASDEPVYIVSNGQHLAIVPVNADMPERPGVPSDLVESAHGIGTTSRDHAHARVMLARIGSLSGLPSLEYLQALRQNLYTFIERVDTAIHVRGQQELGERGADPIPSDQDGDGFAPADPHR